MTKNKSILVNRRLWAICIGLSLLTIQPGCQVWMGDFPEDDLQPATAEMVSEYKVIFGTTKGKQPKIYNGQINNNLTVQDALEEAGATKRFKRGMRVDLARRMENGQVLKMPVNFDLDAGRVLTEQNYAIHPGDEILVRRSDAGMLNDVFKNMKSPF